MAVSELYQKNSSELLKQLQMENALLAEENRKLSETVDWMHDTIWRLIRIQRPEN